MINLLSKPNPQADSLQIRESPEKGVFVQDLTSRQCENPQSMALAQAQGSKRRTTAATKMNEASSRSHGIFLVSVECADVSQLDADGKPVVRIGKLNLVDLAGSERQSKTEASGKQLVEAGNINRSLTTLGEVINKLTRKTRGHIPLP